jgi:hypothetical protein
MRRLVVLAGLAALVLSACPLLPESEERLELLGEVGSGGFAAVVSVASAGGAAPSSGPASSNVASAASSGQGGGCADAFEPNDSETDAVLLGFINDCDGSGATIVAALDGAADVDWYRYGGSDAFGCVVDPHRTLDADGGLRLCKFADCLRGVADVTCEDGSQAESSPAGHPGCCHTQSFGMEIDCDGVDDDADIVLRLEAPATACVEYNLPFHY